MFVILLLIILIIIFFLYGLISGKYTKYYHYAYIYIYYNVTYMIFFNWKLFRIMFSSCHWLDSSFLFLLFLFPYTHKYTVFYNFSSMVNFVLKLF